MEQKEKNDLICFFFEGRTGRRAGELMPLTNTLRIELFAVQKGSVLAYYWLRGWQLKYIYLSGFPWLGFRFWWSRFLKRHFQLHDVLNMLPEASNPSSTQLPPHIPFPYFPLVTVHLKKG